MKVEAASAAGLAVVARAMVREAAGGVEATAEAVKEEVMVKEVRAAAMVAAVMAVARAEAAMEVAV